MKYKSENKTDERKKKMEGESCTVHKLVSRDRDIVLHGMMIMMMEKNKVQVYLTHNSFTWHTHTDSLEDSLGMRWIHR